jgi:hypothetical protein
VAKTLSYLFGLQNLAWFHAVYSGTDQIGFFSNISLLSFFWPTDCFRNSQCRIKHTYLLDHPCQLAELISENSQLGKPHGEVVRVMTGPPPTTW